LGKDGDGSGRTLRTTRQPSHTVNDLAFVDDIALLERNYKSTSKRNKPNKSGLEINISKTEQMRLNMG
jgi:hypothetical protein